MVLSLVFMIPLSFTLLIVMLRPFKQFNGNFRGVMNEETDEVAREEDRYLCWRYTFMIIFEFEFKLSAKLIDEVKLIH